MPKLSIVDSPALPNLALVHGMQVAVGTLTYILNSRPDLTHSVHQVARFVHNPGPAHVNALDRILRYLAGTGDLFIIIGNWTSVDRPFLLGFHLNADATKKTWNWIFAELLELACLLLVRFCLLDHLYRIRCLPPHVKLNIMLILQLPKILSMRVFYYVIFFFFLMTLPLHQCLLTVRQRGHISRPYQSFAH
jgi:hypothetical protein